MLEILLMLAFGFANTSAAAALTSPAVDAVSVKTLLPFSCDAVRPYLQSQGFSTREVPNAPISSRERLICSHSRASSEMCCTADMEIRLQARTREKHDRATKDTLQHLQNILHTRAIRFQDFFNDLLKASKKSFHEMFKKTYGILYEQNSYVFIELFRELEKYYTKGSVDLDDVMDTFFNTLYQKMFTVLNSQYKFDDKYLECVGHHMKEMRPFGDVPQKLGVQIKRSFIATRAFSQALQVAAEVLKNMQQLKASNECAVALTRMIACPTCSGISGNVLACNDMCENVMKGCLAQHAALDADWNHFVEAVDKVADRLLGPFNIEMLVRPINLKISEAIMNFQESSHDVSQRVFTGCGRPVLGRRRRSTDADDNTKEIREEQSLNFEKDGGPSIDEEEGERASSAIILDKLVKEIKLRIRDSRQFWLYLPYKLCNDGLVVPSSNTNNCWNGTHIDKYLYPLSSNGESQNLNPEVRASGPRAAIVREQIFALNSITNRLRSAFNGHDVDWIDADETWTSGSGSGSEALDSVTDDEDGFVEEGSGYLATIEPAIVVEQDIIKSREGGSSTPASPVKVDATERISKSEPGISSSSIPDFGHIDLNIDHNISHNNGTEVPFDTAAAATPRRISFTRALTSYLLPIVVMWFGGCLTEW